MKLHINHLLFLIVFSANPSFSQVGYFVISNPDTAYSGLDLIYKVGFHVLGNAWSFNPPYNGIPIEGEYSFGNACFFIGNDGVIEHRKYFDNNETFPSQEGIGRVPGTFFFSSDDSDNFILPYTKHFGIVQCEDTLQGRLTDRFGMIETDFENGDYSIIDTLYNLAGLCESLFPIGYYIVSDSFLMVLKDNYDDMSITFNWYDFQLNLLSETQKTLFTFEATTTGTAVDESGNLILPGRDVTDENTMALFKVSQTGDSLTKKNVLSSTHPFTSLAIAGKQDSDILVAAYRYNMDYSETEYFLFCFDEELNEKWRKQFPSNIKAITALDEGQGYLVVSMPTSGQPSPFSVSFLNGEGELISSEQYGEENDIPEKIKIIDDSLFAVIGTKFIGYQNSTIGNPYASIFVSVDTIQKLIISKVQENVGRDIQMEIYPNPTTGVLKICLPEGNLSQVQLFDIHGKLLLQKSADHQTIQLETVEFPNGIYILNLFLQDGRQLSQRIVIAH